MVPSLISQSLVPTTSANSGFLMDPRPFVPEVSPSGVQSQGPDCPRGRELRALLIW